MMQVGSSILLMEVEPWQTRTPGSSLAPSLHANLDTPSSLAPFQSQASKLEAKGYLAFTLLQVHRRAELSMSEAAVEK